MDGVKNTKRIQILSKNSASVFTIITLLYFFLNVLVLCCLSQFNKPQVQRYDHFDVCKSYIFAHFVNKYPNKSGDNCGRSSKYTNSSDPYRGRRGGCHVSPLSPCCEKIPCICPLLLENCSLMAPSSILYLYYCYFGLYR